MKNTVPRGRMAAALVCFFLSFFSLNLHAQAGNIDLSFNLTDIGYGNGDGGNNTVFAIVPQSDGKIILGGAFTTYNGIAAGYIARANSDGTVDASFSAGTGFDGIIYTIVAQPDGKLLVGGSFTSYNGTARNRIARLNADGTLDTGFDPGTGFSNNVMTMAVQPDGKIMAGGYFTSFNGTTRNRIARLNADGSLDATFAPTGTGLNNNVNTLALQSDGKVVVGGYFTAYNGSSKNYLARLNTDGTIDATLAIGTGFSGYLSAVAVQADGKIIASGYFTSYNGTSKSYVVRLNTDGTLDSAFPTGTGFDYYLTSVVAQPDGKLLMSGVFSFYNGSARNRIARFNTDGSLDATFVPTGAGFNNTVNTVAVQSDGKILSGGAFASFNGNVRNRIARINADGSFDASFNAGSGFNNNVAAILPQTDGSILVGGSFTVYNGTPKSYFARLSSDGTLDASFTPGAGFNGNVNLMIVQPDGNIIVAGYYTSYNGTSRNYLSRLNADGSLDANFTPGTGFNSIITGMALQSDGKIVAAGYFSSFNGTVVGNLVRLNADGTLDNTFASGTGFNGAVTSAIPQPDGKILVAGGFTSYNGTAANMIARLNADGTLDNTFSTTGTGFNSNPTALALQADGTILVAGNFTDYNGITANRIARLNADGTLDTRFSTGTGFNNMVSVLAVQADGSILAGGNFTSYDGTGRNRMARIMSASTTTLPVTFTSIVAFAKNSGVQVLWNVAEEQAIHHYVVERSADGRNFTAVGTVNATSPLGGEASYSWFDAQPLSPIGYYRVRSIGHAGDTKLTQVVSVAIGKNNSLRLYPSPAVNDVRVTGAANGAKYQLRGINGQVYQQGLLLGDARLDVHNLPAGQYVLVIDGVALQFLKN